MQGEESGQARRTPAGLYRRMLIRIVLLAVGLVLLLTLGVWILQLMMPFLAAWLVAWGMNRVAAALRKRGQLAHKSVTMLLSAVLLLLCVALLVLLGWRFVKEAIALNTGWQSIFSTFTDALDDLGARMQVLGPELQVLLDQAIETAQAAVSSLMTSLSSGMLSWAGQQALRLPSVLLAAIVAVFAVFLICANYADLQEKYHALISGSADNPIHMVRHLVKSAFGDYLGRLLALCLLVMLVDLAGLLLLGIPWAALLSLAMAVLTFLPYTGSGTILLPWAFACLLNGSPLLCLGLLAVYAVSTLVRILFTRRFLKKRSELEKFANLISVFLGWLLWGWPGIILGPVLMIVVVSLYRGGSLDGLLSDCELLLEDICRRMGLSDREKAAGTGPEAPDGTGEGESIGSDIH